MSTPRRAPPPAAPPMLIGWREWIGLPELGIPSLKAKVDTGARTSALHAERVEAFERAGARWVRFVVPLAGPDPHEAPLADRRAIRNTGGVPEDRYVIETLLALGGRRWRIEVSLADRTAMGFDMILGRTAVRRRRLLVDPGRSFLAGEPRSARRARMH